MTLSVLLLSVVLHRASSKFFQEHKVTSLQPPGHDSHMTSNFGFSMGYQGSEQPKLVVGAPMYDYIGKVFSCPLSKLDTDVVCDELDMSGLKIEEKTKDSRKSTDPNLYYRVGTSIAATPNYSLTCAPMVPKNIGKAPEKAGNGNIKLVPQGPEVIGACYLYKPEHGFYEWQDQYTNLQDETVRLSKMKNNDRKTDVLFKSVTGGGLGWQTLVAIENQTLIVAKPTFQYDLFYVQASADKLNITKSRSVKEFSAYKQDFNDFYNIGYGMAAGRFFNVSEILYAVSTGSPVSGGRIIFLKWYTDINGTRLDLLESSYQNSLYIESKDYSSMFGYTLAAADLNLDGYSDLIVGQPAKVDKGKEVGAVIIYFGGHIIGDHLTANIIVNIIKITIIGKKDGSRFGHAIALSDIDSDGTPEIFVSTTQGQVFVLSGYELKKRLFKSDTDQIYLSELTLTQELQEASGFGFSLQVVKDIDSNGCDELAIGSPSESEVKLYRCLPAVSATVSLPSGNQTINANATDFEVKVCCDVIIGPTIKSLEGSISVNTIVTESNLGYKTKFVDTLELKNVFQWCKNYPVTIPTRESATYLVTTTLSMTDKEDEIPFKAYPVLSSWSETKASITVSQYCTGTDCKPSIVYDMVWQDVSTHKIDTTLESHIETAVLTVNNKGQPMTSGISITITVEGADSSMNNSKCSKKENKIYICKLDVIQHNIPYTFNVLLDTMKPYNAPEVTVTAKLQDHINPDGFKSITKPYKFDLSKVSLTGLSHDFKITDKDMADDNIDKFTDIHKYIISNNGPVTWRNLIFRFEITKEPFIQKDDIPILYPLTCSKVSTADMFVYECPLTLKASESITIAASLVISKKELENLITERNTSIRSQLSLTLEPTTEIRNVTILTQLNYNKILSVGNNQTLIIVLVVVVALLLLFILSLVLYKMGFFKRDKKKLTELRASVRKRSVRIQSESNRSARPSAAGEDHCDIEVVEDPFDEVTVTPEIDPQPKDDVELIKESPSNKET